MSFRITLGRLGFTALLLIAGPAMAQSFRVQCPDVTALHPNVQADSGTTDSSGAPVMLPDLDHPGHIKCQEVSGTDGFGTMADGNQIYLFGFGPLSGRDLVDKGKPGTLPASTFRARNNDAVLNQTATAYEPAAMMTLGILAAQQPAPMMAIDEDDEFFLTLTNVGQIMRPDLFEQHTVHFHGYPNASSFFDGVPDASVAINIGGSFTYYYTAPDAGTYFWHCHITPPEHLQMGMVGQLYVRPRQNRVTGDIGQTLFTNNKAAPGATDGKTCFDILCTGQTPLPASANTKTGASGVSNDGTKMYAYNDGDGSTLYDVEYPLQLMAFDPNFHYVGMTFNPEAFADMKDKYFMINGRGYPDTVSTVVQNQQQGLLADGSAQFDGTGVAPAGPLYTLSADGKARASQPQSARIVIPQGKRALLRLSDLNVTDFHTISTLGIPMTVIADNARLLRDLAGNNLYYQTNSLTMGGGESADVILDTCTGRGTDFTTCPPNSAVAKGTYYLYTTNLDHLANDAENFGGMMTEIVVE
jgi:FtsP/CotA-like multicopper oxidase with cupredoxin domain